MQWNLIRFRNEHKLSQQDISDLLGISIDSYEKKERGNLPFTIGEMFSIQHIFSRNIDEIFLPRFFGNSD
ncbi:helix-turn-helix domain-containing protein (plasmid) [Lysinibacillus capsici]|uniref:helix-turn-helix transcriptional regulator n=1 Tax=Lysinibacillus capsici TaxID=2115968 RepID=UPI0021D84152|nr:helix-turn-helix transcriptional regulator [Lysinibacillus capsici]UYB50138.1 helix-turn-helix domain-containing protein [Lysinibacillus capsici]UYB50212.1 helix-turn-helix domain-containing protein [Lysinibacillus capsici]